MLVRELYTRSATVNKLKSLNRKRCDRDDDIGTRTGLLDSSKKSQMNKGLFDQSEIVF